MKNGHVTQDLKEYMLSEKEGSLILKIREIDYGEVVIYMQNGQPERIERTTESVKL